LPARPPARQILAPGAALFFVPRVAHAVGMITAWARLPLRPIIFTMGWVVTLVYAGRVLIA
jgi:uncharacterized membrane protein YecN with MAPEG domain